MVYLIKHFPQELKEASACGMEQLITNSESPFSLRLLSCFFLVATLSSLMALFVVTVLQKGAQRKGSKRVHQGYFTVTQIAGSLSHLRRSHCSWSVVLYFVTYPCTARSLQRQGSCVLPFTSVECEHNSKRVLPWSAFTDCKSAYCIFKIPHFLEITAFEDENLILTKAYYKKEK